MKKKTIINVLLFTYFWVIYSSLLVWFYITHLYLIHHTYIVGNEISSNFPEWCPFGEHKREMSVGIGAFIGTAPFILSIINLVIFNNVNKIIRWILVLLPIIFILALYLLLLLNPLN